MSYNKSLELKKWKEWKQREEQLLRELGVEENIIYQLRDYDYKQFLSDRRIRSRQTATLDTFFLNLPYQDKKEIRSVEDLLNNIENESLFAYLSKTDPETLSILLLRVMGYSVLEISQIIGKSEGTIYVRIHRLKKKLKNFQ
ncbi:RNA polymerase sigma factor [[Eubacterium] hominis]|uniref:RNA polymerase sigma factor n=1 Tax=[Eubacterium] hominis TaxID=2764325 RepID=UPI003A4DBDE9